MSDVKNTLLNTSVETTPSTSVVSTHSKKPPMYKRIIGTLRYNRRVQFILLFLLSLMVINIILIYYDQFNIPSDNTASSISNGIYFTTTQFATIGYGDISPKTTIAKMFSSFVHLTILCIAINFAEEFIYYEKKIKKSFKPSI